MRKYPITLRVKNGVTLNKVIDAVNDLLTYYMNTRASRFNDTDCPLCNLFKCSYEKKCLWFIFHRMSCDEFAEKNFDDVVVALLKKDKKWRAFRVKELKYWLQELRRPGVKIISN